MTVGELLLGEFDHEMAATRRLLACVPDDKFQWQPDKKSFTLGQLANHLALAPFWAVLIVQKQGRKSPEPGTSSELLEAFDGWVIAGRNAIESLPRPT